MISPELGSLVERTIGCHITNAFPISGGDTSSAHRLDTSHGAFFLKSSNNPDARAMFLSEVNGLKAIQATHTISVPTVVGVGHTTGTSFLAMEFVDSKPPTKKDFERLGHQLAQLHLYPTDGVFGWEADNFIGSLPQSNKKNTSWPQFFVNGRLWPQLQLACSQTLLSPSELPPKASLLETAHKTMAKATPSLLHGDLWGGNFLIGANGSPYLIDPSVYYGHAVVDLAMSRLFGGFGDSFYKGYHAVVPHEDNGEYLIKTYQLYYLLVHLNLFGSSYRSSVIRLLHHYC
ncbi:MAG: fructosamine kinase family protein [Flavobacteriaceae bacterium]